MRPQRVRSRERRSETVILTRKPVHISRRSNANHLLGGPAGAEALLRAIIQFLSRALEPSISWPPSSRLSSFPIAPQPPSSRSRFVVLSLGFHYERRSRYQRFHCVALVKVIRPAFAPLPPLDSLMLSLAREHYSSLAEGRKKEKLDMLPCAR